MTTDLHLLDGVLEEPFVIGAALFRPDRSVLHRGLDVAPGSLADVAITARHLFRETHPRILALDLEYERGRAVLFPHGDSVLFLRTTPEARVQTLMDRFRQVPAELTGKSEAPSRDPRRAGVDALNAVLGEAKKCLGGPVIRNYLKRAQREVKDAHPSAMGLAVSLAGTVDSNDESTEAGLFVRDLGALARAFVAAVTTVESTFATFDLRGATAEYRGDLEPLGFYAEERQKPP